MSFNFEWISFKPGTVEKNVSFVGVLAEIKPVIIIFHEKKIPNNR